MVSVATKSKVSHRHLRTRIRDFEAATYVLGLGIRQPVAKG
jgi:hypothetical protein